MVCCCQGGFVNEAFFEAIVVHGACVLVDAITCSRVFFGFWWFEDLLIVGTNYRFYVGHTAVTYFYSVFVEDFVVFGVSWEMFFDEIEELFGDRRGCILIERWVKPYDFAFSVSVSALTLIRIVLKVVVVSGSL